MLDQLDAGGCFGEDGQNMKRSAYFQAKLQALSERTNGLIRGPYGYGMMVAFTPGDGSAEQAKSLMMTMYETGLLGFICGGDPTRIRFLPPPANTTEAHIDHAIDLLETSLERFRAQQA